MSLLPSTIEKLHEKCKNLDSDALILMLAQVQLEPLPKERTEKVEKIFKTYLVRRLVKEGFQ